MQFSAKAEYACVAMLELALRYDDPQPIRLSEIADAPDISRRFLVQILLQLKGAGLILSTRGKDGGYQLAKPPDEITLGEIVRLIDRPETPPERRPDTAPTISVRVIRTLYAQAENAQNRVLNETTLADLVRQVQETNGFVYHI